MGYLKKMASFDAAFALYVQTAAAGTAPSAFVFINPPGSGETYEVMEVSYNFDVAGGAGAQADVSVVAAAAAITAGTTVLSSVIGMTAGARTAAKKSLTATKANRYIRAGSALAVVTSGTLTALAGLCVQILLQPLNRRTSKG